MTLALKMLEARLALQSCHVDKLCRTFAKAEPSNQLRGMLNDLDAALNDCERMVASMSPKRSFAETTLSVMTEILSERGSARARG